MILETKRFFPTVSLYSGLYPQCTQLHRCFWSTDDCKTTLHFNNFSGLKIIISCSPDKISSALSAVPIPTCTPLMPFSAVDLTWSWMSAVKELTTNMKELLLWSYALIADFKNKSACPQQLANSWTRHFLWWNSWQLGFVAQIEW